ncbi:NAD dehydrogenase [Ascosphaera apis ARSEF 7405]|uniref:L-2-hydroxyglutarate dehydrogenase, mitochondrial n=1 Tax=Ascosphaera apis ARSEF 7405 TaxID=392613 RepID=A0A167Z7R2_9EURO|nr:NAD dehydrogenase [Ascosphaera apis ARSEF 7405]
MSLFTATAQAAVLGGQVGTVRRIVLSAATKVIQRAGFSSTRILGRGKDFSHAVIGAGVVGLAVARQLASREGASVVLLERNGQIEAKRRVMGQVIHAGIYYPESSLKTKLCVEGREMLYGLCEKQQIPHRKVSKWILAQDKEQYDTVQNLHKKAKRLNIPTRWISRGEAERLEPSVRARAGILESTETGIVDSHSLMAYLHADFEDKGGTTALMSPVTNIDLVSQGNGGGYRIFTDEKGEDEDSAIVVDSVVNSAGLFACDVSNMVLPPSRHRKPFFAKGNYFSYASSDPKPKRLLYPTPKPGLGGLGTHLTLDLTGRIRFGPDVEWVDGPDDYAPNPARLKEAIQEIKTYLPDLKEEAIDLDYAGIRPKLNDVGAAMGGKGFQDFVIQEEEGFKGFINLLGIESPGLTSSLAIARLVGSL